MQVGLRFRSSLSGGSEHLRTPLLQTEMFHPLGINNSFLADLRTSFIENASMTSAQAPEVVSIILQLQNLLKEAPLIHHIFNLSLANMQDFISNMQVFNETELM
jgi:hypothetical protein